MDKEELNLEDLDEITAARNFISDEEQAEIYRNFSPEHAKEIIELRNQKAVVQEIVNSYSPEEEQISNGGKTM